MLLNVILLNVILLNVILLYVILLNLILLSVILLNAILLNVILLDVILLNVILLCGAAPSPPCLHKMLTQFFATFFSNVRGGIHKTSYEKLTIILKAGVP